jgi:hypothetical protein
MAGTLAEQAELATTNAFIAKVRCAMIFRANHLYNSDSKQSLAVLQQARDILQNAGGQAAQIAAIIASGNATIAAAAPAVPNDSDTQYAVNQTLTMLIS